MGTRSCRLWGPMALAVILGGLTNCTVPSPDNQNRPASTPLSSVASSPQGLRVVVTTTILCDLTRRIAASTIDLTCLLKPGLDGHVYGATPADRKAIEDAQLILYSGYDFEPSLIKLIKATSNPAVKVAVAEKAIPKPLLGEAQDHGHGHEEAEPGEKDEVAAKVPDPHVWQNAENGAQMVRVIQTELSQLVPEQANLYSQNAQTLEAELTQIHRWIKAQIATIPPSARKLVTTHDAMEYYATAYNIPVKGALQGISTEEKPSAGRIRELVENVKASQVPTIFVEIVVNPKLIEAVAREAGVKVSDRALFSDSLGEPESGASTYVTMMIANTQTIVEGLGGKFTPFQPKATP
ncbi:metal ABC transporter substrate-binding protein [Leptolyngbya sp. 'hensonii']|uniref:metal ABC transporter solute-binding protein, Zn/Mn family n=1 Tax=Leptolyngbya sp. 'hensonii' TaxID=1922337 RepID=UPI00094F4E00|nr:zinc ABC transporter substrate-binding protein [Leptolyngbya sp. 'hensonii']OLP16350.1 metal ABC transporter substrate-binding protein [Leptolyngbya sp. 'hensonii']